MKIKAILVVLVLLIVFSSVAFGSVRDQEDKAEVIVPLPVNKILQVNCEGDFFLLQTISSNQIIISCKDFVR